MDPSLWVSAGGSILLAPVLWIYYRAVKDQDRRLRKAEQRLDNCEQDRSLLITVAMKAGVPIPEQVWAHFTGFDTKKDNQ